MNTICQVHSAFIFQLTKQNTNVTYICVQSPSKISMVCGSSMWLAIDRRRQHRGTQAESANYILTFDLIKRVVNVAANVHRLRSPINSNNVFIILAKMLEQEILL